MAKSDQTGYIVGSRGASQLGGSLIGIPLGYKANKLSSATCNKAKVGAYARVSPFSGDL